MGGLNLKLTHYLSVKWMNGFGLDVLRGDAIAEHIAQIAKLRIDIFREYPYLYDGDWDYEENYLRKLIDTSNSLVVVLNHSTNIVGAMTGLPLSDEEESVKLPWLNRGVEISGVYYFSEILLYPEYRGHGHGGRGFDWAEQAIDELGIFDRYSLATVIRPDNHPMKPTGYQNLDGFWESKGYVKDEGLVCYIPWKEVGEEEETQNPLVFWIKKR